MKFVSTYPKLQVILQTKRKLVDAASGEMAYERHSITVRFDNGFYETTDELIIKMMTDKLEDMKRRGLAPSFSLFPGERTIDLAAEDVKSIDPKDEIILDLEKKLSDDSQKTTELEKQIEELKIMVAELSKQKKNKKVVSTEITPS